MRNVAPLARVVRLTRIGAAIAGLAAVPQFARAADPEPDEGASLVRKSIAPSFRPWAGHEAGLGREMTWARWMMASDDALIGEEDPRAAPWLDLAVFRDGPAYARPDAEASALSALGSLAAVGLPMLAVRRDGRIRQRHSLRGWFRGRGLSLAWRIEF